jgi:ribosomal protein S18 acetylase RimI-like enzyme
MKTLPNASCVRERIYLPEAAMRRRYLQFSRDYAELLAMQQVSYALNFPGQELQEQWFRSALLAAARDKRVWVYEQDGLIIGWLWLDRDEPGILHITHIQVREDNWGKGIGRKIMVDAVSMAKREGRGAITLNVTKTNERATTLYHDLGYAATMELGDRQLMRLDLQPMAIDSNG